MQHCFAIAVKVIAIILFLYVSMHNFRNHAWVTTATTLGTVILNSESERKEAFLTFLNEKP